MLPSAASHIAAALIDASRSLRDAASPRHFTRDMFARHYARQPRIDAIIYVMLLLIVAAFYHLQEATLILISPLRHVDIDYCHHLIRRDLPRRCAGALILFFAADAHDFDAAD